MPGNATLLADRADILAMAQGRKFTGEPDRLIQAALQADPRHLKALALAGTSAFDRGDYATAALHWRRYLSLMQPGDPAGREVEERAREAERRATAGGARSLNGTVTFPAGQALTLEPGAVVFVVARAGDGRGRPVAVSRVPVSALPVNFRLDDGDSLSPAAPLSGFSEIVLEARLSRNGIAEARPGDPRSSPRAAKPGERAIVLELGARPG
jgi:cytochrome c-type biogenesis protein CcmH